MTTSLPCTDVIAAAVSECDIRTIACVPGYPTTGIAERLIAEAHAEWCINEKLAMEIALGTSACGSRSMVIVKHVGMNVLADPLITACTHTIGAGIVIIAGDDPLAIGSQNEQDSRYWGLIAEVPVLDPNPRNLRFAISEAYRLSEAVRTPVIVRLTDRLMQSECAWTIEGEQTQSKSKSHLFDRSIWEYSMHGRYQLFHRDTYPTMEGLSEDSHLNVCTEDGVDADADSDTGVQACIISSGYASTTINVIMRQKRLNIPHLSLSFVNPLPVGKIADFIRDRRVLIVEETGTVIESQLQSGSVLGRRSGHLPYGGLTRDDILFAMENMDKDAIELEVYPETLESRGFTREICDDCPFIPIYEAIKTVKNAKGIVIAGDVGCSIRTAPDGVVDLAYALGSAIGVASGMPEKSIAVTGDFGLVHSGLQALLDAKSNKRDVLAIVLQNRVSAMTGGQDVPDMTRVIRACCNDVTVIDESADQRFIERLIHGKLTARGVSVIVANGRCRKYYSDRESNR